MDVLIEAETRIVLICRLEFLAAPSVLLAERRVVRLHHENCYQSYINHGMNYEGVSHYHCQDKSIRGKI